MNLWSVIPIENKPENPNKSNFYKKISALYRYGQFSENFLKLPLTLIHLIHCHKMFNIYQGYESLGLYRSEMSPKSELTVHGRQIFGRFFHQKSDKKRGTCLWKCAI